MIASEAQNVRNWAVIAGRWQCAGPDAHYFGPGGNGASLGLALTDFRATDSTVRLGVTLEGLTASGSADTTGGVVLGYAGQEARYLTVSLGGWEAAYSLGEYVPTLGWRAIARYGTLQNLSADQEYELEIVQRGQKVTLSVDGVRVYDHLLAAPLPGDQVGLFAWGTAPVMFRKMRVLSSKPKLFVAMPFLDRLAPLYEEVIRRRAKDEGFDVVRIDEVARPGIIFQDIQREIADATAVVAEISAANSNVFYELGYAHALNKPTILLAQRDKDLPFDIRSYRVIFYDDTIGGKPALEDALSRHLAAIRHPN